MPAEKAGTQCQFDVKCSVRANVSWSCYLAARLLVAWMADKCVQRATLQKRQEILINSPTEAWFPLIAYASSMQDGCWKMQLGFTARGSRRRLSFEGTVVHDMVTEKGTA